MKLLLLLTLLFSLSGPAMGGYSDFGQSSTAAKTTPSLVNLNRQLAAQEIAGGQ